MPEEAYDTSVAARGQGYAVLPTVSKSRICASRFPLPPVVPGVYWLCRSGSVVYVGASGDVIFRVLQHRRQGLKQFDAWDYQEAPDATARYRLELSLIQEHQPEYNTEGLHIPRFVSMRRVGRYLPRGAGRLAAERLLAQLGVEPNPAGMLPRAVVAMLVKLIAAAQEGGE